MHRDEIFHDLQSTPKRQIEAGISRMQRARVNGEPTKPTISCLVYEMQKKKIHASPVHNQYTVVRFAASGINEKCALDIGFFPLVVLGVEGVKCYMRCGLQYILDVGVNAFQCSYVHSQFCQIRHFASERSPRKFYYPCVNEN